MLKATRFLLMGATAALIGAFALPVFAQEATAEPGTGGIIIEGNFGGDVASLNPIIASDTASTRIIGFIYPGLIGVDPATATFRENDPTALVTDWEISEDGLVYTFTLRDDWTWSDGTPITSADILYAWNAIIDPAVESPLAYLTEYITSVEAPTPNSYVVTFTESTCQNLPFASLPIVPSHVLPTTAELKDSEFNLNPTVSGGVMTFSELRPGEQVNLVANQAYGGAPDGVVPEGFIYRNVADQNILVEQFLAGETNVIDSPAVARRADIAAAGDAVQIYEFPGNAWDYFAMNFADPTNPQPAVDEAGAAVEQGTHPIFGDPAVRQAVSLAVNVDQMIEAAVFGQGERMNAFSVQSSWAYPADLPLIEQDVEAANALLEEAGWVDSDGDGVREKDGTPLAFTLYTNQGNSRREAIGTLFEAQLEEVGFDVDYQAIEFNTILEFIDAQNFDAIILGWRNGYPDDPDQTSLFTATGDTIGGQNFTSYSNPEVETLMADALQVPGCDVEARAAIYNEIQALLQQDLPYIPLFTVNGYYAASADLEGFAPYPSQLYWNVDRWAVRAQ